MSDIREIHRKCLDFLLNYQLQAENFYFVPRKINNKNRLQEGMYFRGNEFYMVLSFWDSNDTKEFIYNINFSVDYKGQSSIELSCRDDDVKLVHITAIKELLESRGKDFKETKFKKNKAARWRYFYPNEIYYLDALQDFITKDKTIIDNYIITHQECGIALADKNLDDKYVKTLPAYKTYREAALKAKKIGAVPVKASEYIMQFQHNLLSNELVSYLKNNGYKSVVTDENFVDITAIDSNGAIVFFELKTATKVKLAIRQAIGQLLEYNHYPNLNNASKLIIVSMSEADENDIQYLIFLRNKYNIPVYYQQFDIDKKTLSKEY